jgi:ornithine cyclodeaminase/alanine dehydrogenase-like protein (mu-crystallin family)
MSETLGIEVAVCDEPRDAVRDADIVAACTDSITPVFFGSWVEPGMHLSCVKPTGEWDDEVEPRIDMVAGGDSPRPPLFGTPFKRGQGNFLTYAAGDPELLERIPRWGERQEALGKRARLVSLGAMIRGDLKGRENLDEVSASSGSNVGEGSTQGLPFVALGARVYELAKQQGLGRELPTELFVQDIRD